MILSHEHRFVFIKTKKTAGTSLEIALSKFCGPDDIITPISEEDEALRERLGHRGPQNHTAPIRDARELWTTLRKRRRRSYYYNHIPAETVRNRIGEDLWERYYTFCFVRNPYDRLISLYYYLHKREPRPSLTEFLRSEAAQRLKTDHLYTSNGEVLVDRVYRYERLQEALEDLQQRIGLPGPLELPRAKAGYRRDRRPYRDLYTDRDAAVVTAMCRQEIDRFDYEF